MKFIRAVILSVALIFLMAEPALADELIKGRATVYSLEGKTAMGTPVRWGVCASGNEALLGKTVIIYQRLPDDSIGDVIDIYSIEDTGCSSDVIDIWCPQSFQKTIINKLWEKNCKGKIYIKIL